MILITGSDGLIGAALTAKLAGQGVEVRRFDIARSAREDVRDGDALAAAMTGVEGVVHLAAVSRIVWAERDPVLTEAVNVAALRGLLATAKAAARTPWVIFASSREVYGEPGTMPIGEDAPLAPLNVYGRSKVAGEALMQEARDAGLLANIVRFSNVYGSVADHADRVAPAFARAAATGGRIRVEGADNMFDFTWIDDVVDGLATHVAATRSGEALPPIQFVTGTGTTLGTLADIAARHGDDPLTIEAAAPRNFDVARFVGDPARAEQLLGWRASTYVATGFARLVEAFRAAAAHTP